MARAEVGIDQGNQSISGGHQLMCLLRVGIEHSKVPFFEIINAVVEGHKK
jgi:hypothetical protein